MGELAQARREFSRTAWAVSRFWIAVAIRNALCPYEGRRALAVYRRFTFLKARFKAAEGRFLASAPPTHEGGEAET